MLSSCAVRPAMIFSQQDLRGRRVSKELSPLRTENGKSTLERLARRSRKFLPLGPSKPVRLSRMGEHERSESVAPILANDSGCPLAPPFLGSVYFSINFGQLVLGCIEADFWKQIPICLQHLVEMYKMCELLHRSKLRKFARLNWFRQML